ncbi:MAG: queuosine precursor transporter [Bacteroidales bacterium]|nr:queuosine precursor transporter [Bacteroidales bacterium]
MTHKHQQTSVLFTLLSTLFTVCLIAANLFAEKQFHVGIVSFTGALLVFPLSYIVNDVVSEVLGMQRAKYLIWNAFFFNLVFVLLGALVDLLPGSGGTVDASFHVVFGLAPRIASASLLAFLVGSFVNAYVMVRMHRRDKERRFVLRAVVSSLAGEACDSLIFFPMALGGIVPWKVMPLFVLWQVLLKTTYEILILPITTRVVRRVKALDAADNE